MLCSQRYYQNSLGKISINGLKMVRFQNLGYMPFQRVKFKVFLRYKDSDFSLSCLKIFAINISLRFLLQSNFSITRMYLRDQRYFSAHRGLKFKELEFSVDDVS